MRRQDDPKRELPRDFIDRIFEATARLDSRQMRETFVVTALVVFNFVLLALAAAAGPHLRRGQCSSGRTHSEC